MAYIRMSRCCCCLSLRTGLFIVTILGILGGGFGTAWSFVQLSSLDLTRVPSEVLAPLALDGTSYCLLLAMSIVGLFGAIRQSDRILNAYLILLMINFLLSLGLEVVSFYILFNASEASSIRRCSAESLAAANGVEDCKDWLSIIHVVNVTVAFVMWIVQLYGMVVVSSITGKGQAKSTQLDRKHSRRASSKKGRPLEEDEYEYE